MHERGETRKAGWGRWLPVGALAAVATSLALGTGTAYAGPTQTQSGAGSTVDGAGTLGFGTTGGSSSFTGASLAFLLLLGVVSLGTGALLRVAPATPPRTGGARVRVRPAGPVALSPREREILELIALGEGTRAIAGRLFLSEDTVKTHVRRILDKLEARTRAEAVAIAIRSGRMP